MAWKDIPEKKVLATLKDGKTFKGTASEKMTIYVDGGVPGGEGDVQGISVTVDPSTYVMTTQLKDGKGGNVGDPATVDLPLESMVVSGEYDDATKSVILTLKNGETVSFSVADLVSGLQTEITAQNPLSADLVAETANKNFVTSEEKGDIDTIPGLTAEIDDVRQVLDDKQDIIDENNPLDASYIDDNNSDKKLITGEEKQALEDITSKGSYMYATMVGGEGYVEFNNDNACHLDMTMIHNGSQDARGVDMNFGDMWVHLANGESARISQFGGSTVLSGNLEPGIYSFDPNEGVQFYIDDNQEYPITDAGTIIIGPSDGEGNRSMYFYPADGSNPILYALDSNNEVVFFNTLVTDGDVANYQPLIDNDNKLYSDLVDDTGATNKFMTSAEKTKLAGIASGAEVNVQSNWNETNSSSDAYIQNKPTNVSAFTNDAGYQDASQVSSAIASAVGDITSFEYQVVQALPQSGEKGVIYLVANSGTTPNIYDEYIWVNNAFEKIGTTDIDLSDYVTNSDLHDYTASVAFTSENGIEITDDDDNSIGFAIETDGETGSQNLAVTGSGGSFNVPNADDVADALAGKADAINPSDLPSGSTQNGVITTSDHTDIDPSVVDEGQIVVDSTEGKVYIVSDITTDPQTGDPVIVWKEIQTENEVVYIPMTITSVQDMTFTVPYTPSEVSAMLSSGLKVMYRLTIPQRISPSLDAGVYDFTAFCSYQSGQVIMATMVGASGNDNIFGIAYHIPSAMGNSRMEMRFLQNKIDANNKISADYVDNSNSTNKTYITGSGAPTTSTAGEVGQIYVDTATGKVYVCTSTTGGTYTWTEVSGTQVNSDWNASSGVAQILNKPSLATVATTGAYSDLTGTPTIPTVGDGVLTIKKNGAQIISFHANATSNSSVNIEVPVITMQTTDPGEGASLAANNFIAVYEA